MKKIFLMALLLLCVHARAQYFQHAYGGQTHEFLSSGVNTTVLGQGHFMSGHGRVTCMPSLATLPVVYTDVNGNIPGAPYFSKTYILGKPNAEVLVVNSSKAFEMDNGTGFGVIGAFSAPITNGSNGIYYLQLDAVGNVTNVFVYELANSNAKVSTVNGICESTYTNSGNEVYITGTAVDLSYNSFLYVLKIDVASGAVLWGQAYDIVQSTPCYGNGNGIVESPYMPYGSNEVVVVGDVTGYAGNSLTDAFMLHLDASTGMPLANATIYGTSSYEETFNSVRVANNTNAGPAGFIIGGSVNLTSTPPNPPWVDFDFWVTNTDPSGNVNWTASYDYSGTAGAPNMCHDVIERLNTNNQWEYYAVGTTTNFSGPFGGSTEIMVEKIDQNGNAVAGGEFLYGNGMSDMAIMVDLYSSGGTAPPDGLSIYGWSFLGGASDMYHIKTYFNGVSSVAGSGCNEKLNNPKQGNAPGIQATSQVSSSGQFNQGAMGVMYLPMPESSLCFSNNIATGDNSLVAPPKQKGMDDNVKLLPNPIAQEHTMVNVEIESETIAEAEITVTDMLGREYYKGKAKLGKGKNKVPVDLRSAFMAAGTYNVTIKTADAYKTQVLLIK